MGYCLLNTSYDVNLDAYFLLYFVLGRFLLAKVFVGVNSYVETYKYDSCTILGSAQRYVIDVCAQLF